MARRARVAVVGGGVVGLACAWDRAECAAGDGRRHCTGARNLCAGRALAAECLYPAAATSAGRTAQSRLPQHWQRAIPARAHFKGRLNVGGLRGPWPLTFDPLGTTPLFITFEGTEGSGKSLQQRLLVERLRAHGLRVLATHEPGGTPLGSELRQLLLARDELEPAPRTEALLMNASRALRDVTSETSMFNTNGEAKWNLAPPRAAPGIQPFFPDARSGK